MPDCDLSLTPRIKPDQLDRTLLELGRGKTMQLLLVVIATSACVLGLAFAGMTRFSRSGHSVVMLELL